MTRVVWSLEQSADHAASLYRTFTDGMPELVPTGIVAFDQEVGGLGPGSNMVVGAGNGIGKSLVALDACLVNQGNGVKSGYISLEDTPDVVGCRLLARYSGVDSKLIRRKALTSEQTDAVRKAHQHMARDSKEESAMAVSYQVGRGLPDVLTAIEELAKAGCKIIWVDYLQKVRGVIDDRRNEVSRVFTGIHGKAAEFNVPVVITSQIARPMDPNKIPTRFALKESGDIENEARSIIMLGRLADEPNRIHGNLDKSTFGGEGLRLSWYRGPCGTLFQGSQTEEEW